MPDNIIETYYRYVELVGENELSLSESSKTLANDDVESTSEKTKTEILFDIKTICNSIKSLISDRPLFFSQFDYSWATKPENYDLAWEARMQLYLLLTISDIPPEHPDFNKLFNICVRYGRSSRLNASAACYQGYKYIILDSSYLKIGQMLMIAMPALADIGNDAALDNDLVCLENFLLGRSMENAHRRNPDSCNEILDAFIDRILSYSRQTTPTDSFSISSECEREHLNQEQFLQNSALVHHFYCLSELSAVLHELVHLLKHQDAQTQRSIEMEIEADRGSCSLMMIFQANSLEASKKYPGVIMPESELFFSHCNAIAGAMFLSMIQIVFTIMFASHAVSGDKIDEEFIEFGQKELKHLNIRVDEYRNSFHRYGFVQTEIMASIIKRKSSNDESPMYSKFSSAVQQMNVLSVILRRRLLRRSGLPGEGVDLVMNFEKNLYRPFELLEELELLKAHVS